MDSGDGDGMPVHDDGWAEIEEAMAAAELPQVPPTSDPERLLRYVLQIHPKYTEMEMMSTHLRLYVTSLEQDLEQARNHSRIMSSEIAGEREKKQFYKHYVDQVIKERNDLLHARTSKKTKSGHASHFTWHSCCKKNGEYTTDLMPSMNAFRGEKLQEAMRLMRNLEDEVRNQERLRQEVNVMLKKTQREHDSKTAADRKHIQQLEKQLVQRAMLQSTMERKLYEVESALARHDNVKRREMSEQKKKLDEVNARVKALEAQCEGFQERQGELEAERDDLQDRLTHVMLLKDELADQVDQLSSELSRAQADADSLRGEVEVLQSEDVTTVKNLYQAKLKELQDEWLSREHDLKSQIDVLRQELRVNETLLQRATVHTEIQVPPVNHSLLLSSRASQDSWARQREEWLRGSTSRAGSVVGEHIGSSLSRSQLSHSHFSNIPDDDVSSEQEVIELRENNHEFTSYADRQQEVGRSARMDGVPVPSHSSEVSAFDLAGHTSDRSFSRSSFSVDLEQSKEVNDLQSLGSRSGRYDDEDEGVNDCGCDEASGDLLADMHEMLEKFKDRRIEEEEKALAAEKALATYRQERDEFKSMLSPVA